MLKLYTDQTYLTSENRKFVFPLLFDLWYSPNANFLEKYQIVSAIADCDIAVVPVDIAYFLQINKKDWLYNFIDKALALQKRVWVYTAGDFGLTLEREVYTFRLGGFHSQLDKNTFILPSFITDPYQVFPLSFRPIPKGILPKVGFVGHANGSLFKKNKELILFILNTLKRRFKKLHADFQLFYPVGSKRFKLLSLLDGNEQIETDFVFRKAYRAGVKSEEERKKTTFDFINNIYNNPYTFCIRGVGNFSVRFYETLAMGRIPLVINTDFRLPLENSIPWEKHCVIANEDDFMEVLLRFHQNISNQDFENMQTNNRNLWLNSLNREAYFEQVHIIFKELIQS